MTNALQRTLATALLLATCCPIEESHGQAKLAPGPEATSVDASIEQAKALLVEGQRLIDAGDAHRGAEIVKKALSLFEAVPGRDANAILGIGNSLYLLGKASALSGDNDRAIDLMSSASERFSILEGALAYKNHVVVLEQLMILLTSLSRYEDAIKVLRLEETVQKELLPESQSEIARTRKNIGVSLMELGRNREAAYELEQAVHFAEEGKTDAKKLAQYLYELGLAQSRSELPGPAEKSFRKALSLLGSLSGTEESRATILLDLAGSLKSKGEFDDARGQLQAALKLIARRPEAKILRAKLLINLANDTSDRLGKQEEALRSYRDALALVRGVKGTEEIQAVAQMNIADHDCASGRLDEAIRVYRQVISLDEKKLSTRYRREAQRQLGIILARKGNASEALGYFLAALRTEWSALTADLPAMTSRRKQMSIDSCIPPILRPLYATAFSSAGIDGERAYDAALLTKALHSEASRAEHHVLSSTATPETARKQARYLELRGQISRHALAYADAADREGDDNKQEREKRQREMSGLAEEAQKLESALREDPGVFVPDARLKEIRAADVRARLKPGELLLEYVCFDRIDMPTLDVRERRYGVFAVDGTTGRMKLADLGEASRVESAIAEFRDLESKQTNPASFNLDEDALAARAEILRRLILDPVLADDANIKRILVAPDGLLALVPFEALPRGRGTAGQWRYLVEDMEIVYLFTGRDLLRSIIPRRAESSHEAWMVGDPDFDATPDVRLAALRDLTVPAENQKSVRSAKTGAFATLGGKRRLGAESSRAVPEDWDRLEDTRLVVEAFAAEAKNAGLMPKILTGALASEEMVATAHSPRLMMFATHGHFISKSFTTYANISSDKGINPDLLESADPLQRSMLVLAGANKRQDRGVGYDSTEAAIAPSPKTGVGSVPRSNSDTIQPLLGDGLLTAYEVLGMDLEGTELVMLTACESGLGFTREGLGGGGGWQQASGESAAGLRQSFFVAGAESLVVSLWPVPLDQTVNQMKVFLDQWLVKGVPRYRAFRASQLSALAAARETQRNGHPFWWAGFVFLGVPRETR